MLMRGPRCRCTPACSNVYDRWRKEGDQKYKYFLRFAYDKGWCEYGYYPFIYYKSMQNQKYRE